MKCQKKIVSLKEYHPLPEKETIGQTILSKMGSIDIRVPTLKDLTDENITENVILMNSLCEDERMKYVFERLVHHLHEFARETRLSTTEWMTGLEFLVDVGKISTDVRNV